MRTYVTSRHAGTKRAHIGNEHWTACGARPAGPAQRVGPDDELGYFGQVEQSPDLFRVSRGVYGGRGHGGRNLLVRTPGGCNLAGVTSAVTLKTTTLLLGCDRSTQFFVGRRKVLREFFGTEVGVDERRHLIPLGHGVYSVSSVCRILGPKMTPRRVHYWLDTGLIAGASVARGARGRPTLLTFQQLLEIKTVQYLRDQLSIPLPKVRDAYAWVLENLFDDDGAGIRFSRGPGGDLIVTRLDGGGSMAVPGGQMALDLDDLNDSLSGARSAWQERRLALRPRVVADARILVGAPTVRNTRIETAIIASFAPDGTYTDNTVAEVLSTYPHLSREAVIDALDFEGIKRAA